MSSSHFLIPNSNHNTDTESDSYDDDSTTSSSSSSSYSPPSPFSYHDSSSSWSTSSPDIFTEFEHTNVLQPRSTSHPNLTSTSSPLTPNTSKPRGQKTKPKGPKFLDIYYVNKNPPKDFRSPQPRVFHRPILPSRLSRGNLTKKELSYVVHAIRQDNVIVDSHTIHAYASRMISHYKPE